MKKFFAVALALTATGAFAATSGTLLLKGTVPRLLSITVDAEAVASNLPLDTTQLNTKVAEINERSNSNTGYKVNISSATQGKLVHESVGTSFINYTLRYAGQAVDLSAGEEFVYSGAGSNNVTRDVDLSYTGVDHESLIEGEYSDTVTFTIAAN